MVFVLLVIMLVVVMIIIDWVCFDWFEVFVVLLCSGWCLVVLVSCAAGVDWSCWLCLVFSCSWVGLFGCSCN